MEERTVKLTFDKAKEWYKKGGELKEVALQAYKEIELRNVELPKTWEEFCINYSSKIGNCFIDRCCEIISISRNGDRHSKVDKNLLPSKEAAEAHLALMQLHQLRDCYRRGWIPNWKDNTTKYCIVHMRYKYYVELSILYTGFLSFQSEEIAKTFLNNFGDLIQKAGDLI